MLRLTVVRGGLFKHYCTSGKRELPRGTSAVGQVPTGQTRNASAAVSAVGDMFVGQDYTCHIGFRKGRSPE